MPRTPGPLIINPPIMAALDNSSDSLCSKREAYRRRRVPQKWSENRAEHTLLFSPRHDDDALIAVFGADHSMGSLDSWTLEPVNEQDEQGGWRWCDERDPFSDESECSSSGGEDSSVPSTPPLETPPIYLNEESSRPVFAYSNEIPDEALLNITPSPPTTPSQYKSHNSHFHTLSRNRFNLCIDSVDPHIAPHIVISPPDFVWQDYYTPAYNGVPYQWASQLMVPPVVHYTTPHAAPAPAAASPAPTIDAWAASHETVYIPHIPEDEPSTPTSKTHRHRRRRSLDAEARERRDFPAFVTAAHRHCFRSCLLTIIAKVPSLRPIYDAPGWRCSAERPFEWTDPGAVLLSLMTSLRGLTVLDSSEPFRVPHIAILAPQWPDAPDGDPWASAANCPPCPQDAGNGVTLCVPGVPVVNDAPHSDWEASSSPDSVYEGIDDYYEFASDDDASTVASSPPDSPTIGTPRERSPKFTPREPVACKRRLVDEESVQHAIAPESAWCG